jgi:hypothetical protein
MFLFPIIYIVFFAIAVFHVLRSKPAGALLFIIFGLPIYITSLSIVSMYGLKSLVPILQSFKEVIVLLTAAVVVLSLKKKPQLHFLDKVIVVYFLCVACYVVIPVGEFSLKERMLSLKSIAFFPVIYFIGRLMDVKKINLNEYFQYICIVAIPTAIVVIWEAANYTHFQTFTGYAEYMSYFFNLEASGNHGLNWTFEAENDGPKRFASIFANPLDHAAGTLTTICALLALITTNTRKIKMNRFLLAVFICTLFSIVFALSRAAFVSYFIILYTYAYITNRRSWLNYFYYGAAIAVVVFFTFMSGDIYQFIIGTINFSNSSSVYHIIAWLDGIEAIVSNPLGLGLGSAGKISGAEGINVGGENQLLIIGVQAGLIALLLYLFIYIYILRTAFKMTRTLKGKARKVAIFILLLKLGMIIPFLTAEAESYVYVSYITWFFSGLMINIKYYTDGDRSRYQGPETRENGTENNAGGDLQTIQVAG